MLGKLFSPLTTAAPSGVALRDLITGVGAVIAMLGVLGFLTAEQVAELTKQAPSLLTAIGVVIYGAMSIYRVFTKSSSDKAAAAAKQIDTLLDPQEPVRIQTPGAMPDILVMPPASK